MSRDPFSTGEEKLFHPALKRVSGLKKLGKLSFLPVWEAGRCEETGIEHAFGFTGSLWRWINSSVI